MNIEPLEARIAPAFTFSPSLVTYIDVDGDFVSIKSSKPVLDDADFIRTPVGLGHQLQSILLNDDGTAADGLSLTITATPKDGHGDGFVSIGYINASGRVLGSVTVDGDLGVIDAGATATNPFALQSLTVQSLGLLGATTGAPADLRSDLVGSVKSITIKGNVRDALVDITGSTGAMPDVVFSSLGALTIGGSQLGGSANGSGSFNVAGNIGPVKVGGSIVAGAGQSTGQIGSIHGSIGAVTIAGDLIGGLVGFSGYIFATTSMGAVTIGGDVRGGGAGNTGLISAGTSMGAVKIGGALLGGAGQYSGTLFPGTDLRMVTIHGDVKGGGGYTSGAILTSTGSIAGVSIGGSLIGGGADSAGSILASVNAGTAGKMGAVKIGRDIRGGTSTNTGRISAAGDIGPVTIGGSLIGGNTTADAGLIAAGGALGKVNIVRDIVGGSQARTGWIHAEGNIASLTVGGSITGGDGDDSGTVATEASLGKVKIGGDLKGAGGMRSGRIFAVQNMGAVNIAGSLIGAGGDDSGQIGLAKSTFTIENIQTIGGVTIGGDVIGAGGAFSGSLRVVDTFINEYDFFGAVKVAGDWKGGSGYHAGSIHGATLTSITLGGSLIGGSNTLAGGWQMTAKSITIGGDVIGGSAGYTGYISSNPKTLTIGGSLLGGTAGDAGILAGTASKVVIGHDFSGSIGMNSFGSLTIGGSIIAGGGISGFLGAITVKGSIIGTAAQEVQIIGRGDISLAPGLPPYIPLPSLTVGGRVEHALIAVGFSSGAWVDPDAQIGAVKVGGDWIASNLLAGIDPTDGQIGDGNDHKADLAMRDHPELFSKIASVVIGGHVIGDPSNPGKTYGFGAEEIGSFKVNGVSLSLTPGKNNDKFAGSGAPGNAIAVGSSRGNVVNDTFAVHVFEI